MEEHVRKALERMLKRDLARLRRYGEKLPASHPLLERLRERNQRRRDALERASE